MKLGINTNEEFGHNFGECGGANQNVIVGKTVNYVNSTCLME